MRLANGQEGQMWQRNGSNYADVNVLCPYYHECGAKEIVCEGVQEHTQNILRFGRGESRKEYMAKFCNREYKSCEICHIASHKYI